MKAKNFLGALSVIASLATSVPAAAQTCGTASWTIVGPESRDGLAFTYDAARGNFVLYAGVGGDSGGNDNLSDTWTFDGSNWMQQPVSGPGVRYNAPMVYDAAAHRSLLFGGGVPNQNSRDDTWSWNGSTWTLVSAGGPIHWEGASLAYDNVRGRAVLFVGGDGDFHRDDTYEWNGTDWVFMGTGPGKRFDAAMSFDPVLQKTILYGGLRRLDFGVIAYLTDTWAWDGVSWVQIGSNGPAGSQRPSMAFDDVRNRMVLFGGSFGGEDRRDGTWEWTGSSWTAIPVVAKPSPRYAAGMATDGATGRVMLFGGRVENGLTNDMWRLDDTTWTPIRRVPSPRSTHAMAYDAARGNAVMYGGQSSGVLSDTWTWDGSLWTPREVAGPGSRAFQGMTYDSVRERVVLFGGATGSGSANDTWEWDGASWTKRNVTGPSARTDPAMTFDEARGEVVLYGGDNNQDTWLFNGSTWRRAATAGPGGHRILASMVYDSVRRQVILFGGQYQNGSKPTDTWAWNGSSWNLLPIAPLGGRTDHLMVHDPDLRRVIVIGWGNECWALGSTATAWERLPDTTEQTINAAAAYDMHRSTIVVNGGQGGRAGSNTFLFHDRRAPSIVEQPLATSTCPGGSVTFAVDVIGTPDFTYQWRQDGVPIDPDVNASAATDVLVLDNVHESDQASYDCIVTNDCGSTTSSPATLVVLPSDAIVTLIDPLAGGGAVGTIQSLSSNGGIAFGRGDSSMGQEAFRAILDAAPTPLGDLPGGATWSAPSATSRDGMIMFGVGDYDGVTSQAVKWTQAAGMTGIGWAKGGDGYSFALGCSADGTVAVGHSAPTTSGGNGMTAFRWRSSDGMTNLGDLAGGIERSEAYECSADGSVIIGAATDASGRKAAIWTQGSGWQSLGHLPGGADSQAAGCSADGSVLVGYSSVPGGIRGAVWLVGSGVIDIGDLAGGSNYSRLWRISPDASVAVGYGNSDNGDEAAIWDAENGLRHLATVIERRGGTVPAGWTLVEARCISADKGSIGGFARNASNELRGFIVRMGDIELGTPGEPFDVATWPTGSASFNVIAAGDGPFSYQWQCDGVDLIDGATGTGSVISGATSDTLMISDAGDDDERVYSCIVSSGCASISSAGATLSVCPADFNQDGFVTGDDFDGFVIAFENGDIAADFIADGFVTGDDFDAYVVEFEGGC